MKVLYAWSLHLKYVVICQVLIRVLKMSGLTNEVTLEQRREGSEGVSHEAIGGRALQVEGKQVSKP